MLRMRRTAAIAVAAMLIIMILRSAATPGELPGEAGSSVSTVSQESRPPIVGRGPRGWWRCVVCFGAISTFPSAFPIFAGRCMGFCLDALQ